MDAAFLRTCLGLRAQPGKPVPELPDAVRRAHYDMARSLSILGAMGPGGMKPVELAVVVVTALREPDMPDLSFDLPDPVLDFMAEVESGRVVSGQKVVVRWQMKEQPAHFIEKDGDRVKLLVSGDERRFRPDLVRVALPGDFPEFPNNINS